MAGEADRALLAYIEGREESYALVHNVWLRHDRPSGEGETPREGEQWTMHVRTKTLDGRLLLDEEKAYTIGRHELPACIEMNADELHHGDALTIVSPWYAAYGMYGNEQIPPYTNVIIQIEVH